MRNFPAAAIGLAGALALLVALVAAILVPTSSSVALLAGAALVGTEGRLQRPPTGYSAEARRLWRSVAGQWSLEGPMLTILDSACRALMRVREAQALLTRDGIVVHDRFGQARSHPAVAIERDAKQTMLRNLRALNLDLEPLHDEPGRPGGR